MNPQVCHVLFSTNFFLHPGLSASAIKVHAIGPEMPIKQMITFAVKIRKLEATGMQIRWKGRKENVQPPEDWEDFKRWTNKDWREFCETPAFLPQSQKSLEYFCKINQRTKSLGIVHTHRTTSCSECLVMPPSQCGWKCGGW